MIEYAWNFPQFDVAKSEDGLTDVVKVIHWRYGAKDGAYVASLYGSVSLGAPNPDDFIPYDQLTPEWAIACVSNVVSVPDMDVALAAQLEAEKNPPVSPMPPPFAE